MTPEDKLRYVARNFIEYDPKDNVEDELDFFFGQHYTIIELEGNGIIGYIETNEYIFFAFAFNDNLRKNTKKIYRTAKNLKKRIIYGGKIDHYKNNSKHLGDNIYELMI
jgi:hypothetical protein